MMDDCLQVGQFQNKLRAISASRNKDIETGTVAFERKSRYNVADMVRTECEPR